MIRSIAHRRDRGPGRRRGSRRRDPRRRRPAGADRRARATRRSSARPISRSIRHDPRNRADRRPGQGAGRTRRQGRRFPPTFTSCGRCDARRGNGVALVDVVNRGRKMITDRFNRGGDAGSGKRDADLGDGFLMRTVSRWSGSAGSSTSGARQRPDGRSTSPRAAARSSASMSAGACSCRTTGARTSPSPTWPAIRRTMRQRRYGADGAGRPVRRAAGRCRANVGA